MNRLARSLQHLAMVGCLWLSTPLAVSAQPAKPASSTVAPNKSYAADIARARDAWDRDSKKIAELLRELQRKADAMIDLEKDLAKARKHLEDLKVEKAQAIQDLFDGDFCSGCGRTRRALLAAGEPFPHPGQVRRSANAEDFAKVENDYNERMAKARARIKELEDKLAKGAPLGDIVSRLMQLIHDYHQQMMSEQRFRLLAWAFEKESLEQDLEAQHRELTASVAAVAAAQDSTKDFAVTELRARQRQFDVSVQKAASAESRTRQKGQEFVTVVRKDMDALAKIAETIPDKFGIPSGWYWGKTITSPPLPLDCVILAVKRFDPPGTAGSLDDLLGAPTRAPAKPSAAKSQSMKDFLEQK